MQAARRTTDALEGYSRRARGWVQRRAWVVGGTPTRAPKKYTPLGPGLTSYVYGGGGGRRWLKPKGGLWECLAPLAAAVFFRLYSIYACEKCTDKVPYTGPVLKLHAARPRASGQGVGCLLYGTTASRSALCSDFHVSHVSDAVAGARRD